MDSDIEFLEHIFDLMKQAGLMETKSEFSQTLLGKGPSYLTSMSARDRKVPMEVLDQMSVRLFERAEQTNAAIGAMEKELCYAMKHASREVGIRDAFEEHRRRRLAEEFHGIDGTDLAPAPTTSRFIQTVLRKTGLANFAVTAHRIAQDRTLH